MRSAPAEVVDVPELPDVEVKGKYIARTSVGRPILGVSAKKTRILDNVTPASLARALKGTQFTGVKRRGKYLLIGTGAGDTLLMHFGMTGDVVFLEKGETEPKFDKAAFVFNDGTSLHFTDIRMFGRLALYHTLEGSEIPAIARLGPEPLDRSFTFAKFAAIASSHRTTIHQVLMDQELIAGIGNIYSDEITYQAGVLPDRRADSLSDDELRRVYDKMKWTLRRAIALDADVYSRPDVFLIPHRDKKGVCPHGHPLESRTIGGRTSYYCPVEQR